MSDIDLRTHIKEMLIKNLMLQTTPDQIGDDLPLFGPNGLGLDSIDALELVVSMEKTFGVGVPSSEVAGKVLRTVNTIHDYILEKRGVTGKVKGSHRPAVDLR
jgi:acyl carrier protein